MSIQSVEPIRFSFLPAKRLEVERSSTQISGDAGLIPIRQFDEQIRFTEQFAAALTDLRSALGVVHSLLSMVRQRLYGLLPITITCAENDQVLLVGLRHGTAHAALGADDDLRSLTARFRAAWPDVEIVLRGDSGFGVPAIYDVCEELGLTDTLGLGMNARLKRESDELLAQAVAEYEQTGQKQRLFRALEYQADSWPHSRQVVVKCEAHEQGTNRRAVVTNRPGWSVLPQAVYDEYAERGESENRNKELKCDLSADRLSDHRFLANFFRLYLHVAALNLLVRLRRATARPLTPAAVGLPAEPVAEALEGRQRKAWFHRRRRADALGEGFGCTWRTRLIKCAAEVLVSARRVVVRVSSSWPFWEEYERISAAVAERRAAPG